MPDHTKKARHSKGTAKSKRAESHNEVSPDPVSYELQDTHDLTAGQVLQLQHTIGNAATIRFLDKRQPNRIQRCTGRPDCQCPKCRAKRAGLEIEQPPGDAVIHRAPSSTPTLNAPELAGDARLQEALAGNKSKYLRYGQHNDSVKKVQDALLKLNYRLPNHGADGKYGDETWDAITDFQLERGEKGDGIVGPLTLKKLNSSLLSPKPPTPGSPGMTVADREVKGLYNKAGEKRNEIFFEKGSFSLSDDPTALTTGPMPGKIKQIAQDPLPIVKDFTITGLRSEDEPDALASQRTDAVAAELDKELKAEVGSAFFTLTKAPNVTAGDGKLDYRRTRMVTISETGGSSTVPECKVITCPDKTQLTADFNLADSKLDTAIGKLSDSSTDALLTKYFNTTPANKVEAIDVIRDNLTSLKTQLATHLRNETPEGRPGMQCGTQCFESCDSAIAFVADGTGTSARMVLCPGYFNTSDANRRAEILIHEGSHSIKWKTLGGETADRAEDHAYSFARLNTELETEFALVNADSYTMFISELLAGSGGGFKSEVPTDSYDSSMDATAKKNAQKAIAYVQMYLTTATTSMNAAYEGIENAQRTSSGWGDDYSYKRLNYALVARRFQLTLPPAPPTADDQIAVAAIFDQMRQMYRKLRETNIKIKQDAGLGASEWKEDSGLKLTLGSDFLAASDDRARTEILLLAFIKSRPDISSNLHEQYAGLAGDLRRQRSLAEPPGS